MARPDYLRYLLDFTRAWKGLPEARRDDALRDPWAFKDLACEIDGSRGLGPARGAPPSRAPRLLRAHHLPGREEAGRGQFPQPDRGFPDADQDKLLLQIRRHFEEQYGRERRLLRHLGRARLWDPEDEEPADTTPWGQFIHWARLFYERPDFDEEERATSSRSPSV